MKAKASARLLLLLCPALGCSRMANAAGLEVRESGRALRFHTETPHLVSTGSGRLSTTVTLHPLPEGRIILGSSREADIQLGGSGVEFVHCIIENAGGSVTLHPLSGSTCVDGVSITAPLRLTQGCMLTIGRSNYLRFNHPAEAKHLRSASQRQQPSGPHSLNGCPEQQQHREVECTTRPPVAPRRSPRDSGCSDDEVNFLGKLTKFEMLARQARANCVSPKVFPSGSLTTNVPAEQILGHSRSSSLASLGRSSTASPFQNLTNLDRCHNNDEHKMCSLPLTINRNYSASQNVYQNVGGGNKAVPSGQSPHWQQQQQRLPASHELIDCSNDENRNNLMGNGYPSDLMTRSLTCQRSCELGQYGHEFDMSQSLIVAKTTTCTEFLQLDQFAAGPALPPPCHRRAGSCDSQSTQTFGSHSTLRRIQPPSPAYDREPCKYASSESRSLYGRIRAPGAAGANGCRSLEELREAEGRARLAHEERRREQELELEEKRRLEEILATCAEYERLSSRAAAATEAATADQQPRQETRSTTNGTLPRDTRSDPRRPTSPRYEVERPGGGRDSPSQQPAYENVSLARAQPEQQVTPNNNRAPAWPQHNGYAPLACRQSRRSPEHPNYEEIGPEDYAPVEGARPSYGKPADAAIDACNGTPTMTSPPLPEKHVKLSVHNYENFVPLNGNLSIYENVIPSYGSPSNMNNINNNNNNANNMSLPRPKKPSREGRGVKIDNKLDDVSNDDLLEAIAQLSMLSKPRNSTGSLVAASTSSAATMTSSTTSAATTPKRINSERDNAKSNEVKADKERKELEVEDRKKYVEFLQNEKQHILGNMDGLKRSVADIETQEEEINRELELEKALLSAEYESETLKLEKEEEEHESVQAKIEELEREMEESNASQTHLQAEARQRVLRAQQACAHLEEELVEAEGRDDQRDNDLAERLAAQTETLETERKAFEDLEFHHLEEEASRLATREELQRYLGELSTKIETRKIQLSQLKSQRTDIEKAASKESKALDRQKLAHLRRLEEGRNRLRAIDGELESLAKNAADNPDDKRSPSREDFDRISRVTTDSPIVNNQGSLGRKTIESLKEIERNRQLHLAKQGSQVISEERRRVEELKRRVQDEVRSQWEERKMNCTSLNSVESGEESSSYSTGPTESGSGSSDGADNGTGEKLSPGKLSEFTSPSPGPSGNSYTLLQADTARDERPASMETERFNGNGSGLADGAESRPLSQTSSELDSLGPLQVKHRDKPKLQRPLTRYLPIKSESLDLRHHIETAGHQLPLIHDVTVDVTSCSGYLSKMSKRFHHWNKRWFVFDRKRKTLAYYSDNNSRKPRGVIYFQSIEEVYVDHMNTVKSPQPSLTFIVKTTTRLYHLMAPSPEAMRVWVDVVFTGAEGYHEFDPNS